jgi:glucosamine--fructose-6-phosphate aminotransferase (isomerizing)
MNGEQFAAEIREQPAVWASLAASSAATQLAAAIGHRDPLFIGSGSSLFVAQLAALAWRRHGLRADAVAASEARFQASAHRHDCVVALSQSGRTADVLDALDALDALDPARTIALTNDAGSPLALRADVTIPLGAGPELAVPASKSVTAMAALLLWTAAGAGASGAADLAAAASALDGWFSGDAGPAAERAATLLEPAHSIVVIGAGYGVPVAAEIALKIKEASYRHAEGFAAGEFRHGSTAILDPGRGTVGLLDEWSRGSVGAVLDVARAARTAVVTLDDAAAAGGPFGPLFWIAGGQLLALTLARRAGIDSDAPRGLRKFLA